MAKRPKKEVTVPDSVLSLSPAGKNAYGKLYYSDNPFVTANNFVVSVSKKAKIVGKGMEVKDNDGNLVSMDGVVSYLEEVDSTRYIKLFTSEMGIMYNLNVTARRILDIVFAAVQDQAKDKAEIYLTYAKAVEYCKELGIVKPPSKATFSSGIQMLCDKKIIAVHYQPGWYWTNPSLLFNGDRMLFMRAYIKERTGQPVAVGGTPPKQQMLIEVSNPLEETENE